jgi:arabinogalactan endo-1,4-beta-galactosidase
MMYKLVATSLLCCSFAAVREYTEQVVVAICRTGAAPDWVQVGNEITV